MSNPILKRVHDELRLQMRAIEILLRAKVLTTAKLGKARGIARKQLFKPAHQEKGKRE